MEKDTETFWAVKCRNNSCRYFMPIEEAEDKETPILPHKVPERFWIKCPRCQDVDNYMRSEIYKEVNVRLFESGTKIVPVWAVKPEELKKNP